MVDNKVLIVILGINSRQGSSIARRLVAKAHLQLRGVTTNLASERSQSWLAEGIAMVQVQNYRNTALIETAIHGATAIFAVTDFYHYLSEHSTLTLADVWKRSPEEVAAQRELAEGKAIIAAAAAVKGLKLFVLSSLSSASGETEDARGLQQFHSKAAIVQYMDNSFPDLGKKTSLLKPALYMEDWTEFLRRTANGRFTFGTTLPATFSIPWTNVTNDMGTLFHLCMAIPPRLNVAAISDIKSGDEICRLFTEISGIPCDYVQYSATELADLLGPRGRITVDMLNHLFRKRYYEEPGIQLSHHILKRLPNALTFRLTTFAEYMQADIPRYLQHELGGKEAMSLSGAVETLVFHSGSERTPRMQGP